jgi:plasmid stabilization system protein ParE
MKVRFNKRSLRKLDAIEAYIAKDSPASAVRVVATIAETALRLGQFPMLGRAGRAEGRRELVVPDLPYINAYRVMDDVILIDSILHTSRNWTRRS